MFLSLGFLVGAIVTKTIRRLLEPYLSKDDSSEYEEMEQISSVPDRSYDEFSIGDKEITSPACPTDYITRESEADSSISTAGECEAVPAPQMEEISSVQEISYNELSIGNEEILPPAGTTDHITRESEADPRTSTAGECAAVPAPQMEDISSVQEISYNELSIGNEEILPPAGTTDHITRESEADPRTSTAGECAAVPAPQMEDISSVQEISYEELNIGDEEILPPAGTTDHITRESEADPRTSTAGECAAVPAPQMEDISSVQEISYEELNIGDEEILPPAGTTDHITRESEADPRTSTAGECAAVPAPQMEDISSVQEISYEELNIGDEEILPPAGTTDHITRESEADPRTSTAGECAAVSAPQMEDISSVQEISYEELNIGDEEILPPAGTTDHITRESEADPRTSTAGECAAVPAPQMEDISSVQEISYEELNIGDEEILPPAGTTDHITRESEADPRTSTAGECAAVPAPQMEDISSVQEISYDELNIGDEEILPPAATTDHITRESEANSRISNEICRFPNRYNHSCMNATLQAALNLKVVREKLMKLQPEYLTQLSTSPAFVRLFLEALHNPGRSFILSELAEILAELSNTVPSLCFSQTIDPPDLLQHVLAWLNDCGVRTTTQVTEECKCEECKITCCKCTTNLGSIYFLPSPCLYGSTASLLRRAIKEGQGARYCDACGSAAERQEVWDNVPDILTLNLSRTENALCTVLRDPVYPTPHIVIPVGENKTQVYSLSSVICQRDSDEDSGHMWSYLFSDPVKGTTIKADGDRISVVSGHMPADIYRHGIIYLYEKCT
ncbi:uncharacterized protein LOC141777010 [Sebastes fasciatus]|uniref:uncharacterized protein LOC141777010 n=1 Tax=Sebastes fasciatus TaxID=394691 RepID=UPI003D9E0195